MENVFFNRKTNIDHLDFDLGINFGNERESLHEEKSKEIQRKIFTKN